MQHPPDINTVADIVRQHALNTPDQLAIKHDDQTLSYAQLHRDSNRIAHTLNQLGLSPGDRIAWLGRNSVSYFQCLFGTAKAGVCLVVLNWRLSAAEVKQLVIDAEPAILFVDSEFAENIEGLDVEGLQVLVVDEKSEDGDVFGSWHLGSVDSDYQGSHDGQAPFLQMYTSGTTGIPKGAVISHNNATSFLKATRCERHGWWTSEEKVLVAMPCFHVSGTIWALIAFLNGATAIVMSAVDIEKIISLSSSEKITQALFVPTVLQMILGVNDLEISAFSTMKNIYYGAAPMPTPLIQQAMKSFTCGFREVYGATELTGGLVILSDEEHVRAASENSDLIRSCGKPIENVELKIVDQQGQRLPVNSVGEIHIKSPAVMLGYWRRPEATAKVIKDGWYHTGDLGYLDDEGFLFISDRIKDMIISGGENIYPAEIESALSAHPAVLEAAVIGVPNEKWGEEVKAVIALKASMDASEDDLIAHCNEKLAAYKVPVSVDFVERLPRNPSGKILKAVLRKPYWESVEGKI